MSNVKNRNLFTFLRRKRLLNTDITWYIFIQWITNIIKEVGSVKNDKIYKAYINPLAFFEVDEPWASAKEVSPNLENILNYLCTPGIKSDIKSLIKRYKKISEGPHRLFAPPAEEHILEKLIWPLRNAKACYMTGNYLGTISLCGMVSEMAALLLFEIADFSINNQPLDKDKQVQLFGSRFEKLSQERRIAVLSAYNLIDDEIKTCFNTIRSKRRLYLHFYSQSHKRIASDAIEVFNAIMKIIVKVIGQDLHNGKIVLNPALSRYLEKKGMLKLYKNNKTKKTQKIESKK